MGKNNLILIFMILSAQPVHAVGNSSQLQILGWVENAYLSEPGIELKAKLDTGAETSSLDSRVLKKFRREGKRWVRFVVTNRESGEEFVLVRERVRTIGVVQHDGSKQTRPVVKLELCIAGEFLETEVSLIDRSAFNYPLLVGRNALATFALVDASETFLGRSRCDDQVRQEGGS
jgi:hypothetical protein